MRLPLDAPIPFSESSDRGGLQEIQKDPQVDLHLPREVTVGPQTAKQRAIGLKQHRRDAYLRNTGKE